MIFSIIIPLYNKAYSIEGCINSVLSQSYPDFEVIVVNDGSTDNSLSIVSSSFSDEIARGIIKVIDQPNQGVSVARNNGTLTAQSNFICFLDADDEWKPDFLHNMKSLIEDYPEAALYCLQHETKSLNQHPVKNRCYYKNGFRGYVNNFYKASLFGSIANSSKVCVVKKDLMSIGGFPENQKSGEDLYLWMELARLGKIAFYNKVFSRVNIKEDLSRIGRSNSIPYPLTYYSIDYNSNKLSFWARVYLRRIYLAHINDSIKNKQYKSALMRTEAGKYLFPILSKILVIGIQKTSNEKFE